MCIFLIRIEYFFGLTFIFSGIRPILPGQLVLHHMNKRIVICIASMLFAGFTASCGPLNGMPKSNAQRNAPSSETLTGQNNASMPASSALEVPAPVALPPKYNDRPSASGGMPSAKMPNGLPALQPKGVNVNTLFDEELSDTDRRFDRLEYAVLGLRQEFESFKPAIVRLVAVEADIQDLIKQLDMLLRSEPTAPPAPLTPPPSQLSPADQAAPSTPKVATNKQPAKPISPKPPPAKSGEPVVHALRVGQHTGKTRLVIDASEKTAYSVELDNQENLLIIEMPDARWNASKQKSFARSPLLKSYSVEDMNDGKGSRVILSLKKSTQVIKEQALPPGPNPNYRIFLDLKA